MLSAAELALLLSECGPPLVGRRLRKIYSSAPGRFLLRFQGPSGELEPFLLLVLEGPWPRVNLTTERPAAHGHPEGFVMRLRSLLAGSRLRDVGLLHKDRVVRLSFAGRQGAPERELLVELLPRRRNLVLVEGEQVLAALREGQGPGAIRPGSPYQPPSRPPGLPPGVVRSPFDFLPVPPDQPGLAEVFERFVIPAEAAAMRESLRRPLLLALRTCEKRECRLQKRLRARYCSLPESALLRSFGEALKRHLGQLRRGQEKAELPDWSSGEERILRIPLDPRLGPRENMEQLFKRARKAERARPELEGRLALAAERLQLIQELREKVRAAGEPAELHKIRQAAARAGLLPHEVPEQVPGRRATPARHLPYRHFRSLDGLPILVGKNAAENDALTFKLSRGNDFWLHVDGFSGSHVVVRAAQELPRDTLLDAATLALLYSKAPRGGSHDVSWTRCKWVRKFKGARSGQVQLACHKTLRIRLDAARLARLKASRGPADDR